MDDVSVVITSESVSSASSTPDRELSPREEDWECGEPLVPQHLVVDFTPQDIIDTDFVQKKCCAFWDFVNSCPELRDFKVLPDPNQYKDAVSETASEDADTSRSGSVETTPHEKTALSVLSFVESKGLINRAFEAQLPAVTCSLGSTEYQITLPKSDMYHPMSADVQKCGCKCNGICKSCKNKEIKEAIPSSRLELKHLCENMQDWDDKHPKSMDPPGRTPGLSHCEMQRKITS